MEPRFEDHAHHIAQLTEAALAAADPSAAVNRHLRKEGQRLSTAGFSYDLGQGRTFLVAIGKAAVPMGIAAAEILADAFDSGVLVTKKTEKDWHSILADSVLGKHPDAIELIHGGHPISNVDSVVAAHAVTELLSKTKPGDLVLFLISGGASAVLSDPMIPLEEWQQLNEALLASGCSIAEINCVRRQLDRVKGGGLARQAAPAACCSLILSDVVGNPIDMIGSGPTVVHQEESTNAIAVLTQCGIGEKMESEAWSRIIVALEPKFPDAEPNPEIIPPISHHEIIGDVRQAAQAALIHAAKLGFISQILTTRLQGESREVAHVVAAIAQDLSPGRCLILGGETTVTLSGQGQGGRNQEMALATAIDIADCAGIVVAYFATDGEDGTTEAAGAIVTGNTIPYARAAGLSAATYLSNNDSHAFFSQLDELDKQILQPSEKSGSGNIQANHLIETGATGTNVNDLVFVLTYRVPTIQESDPEVQMHSVIDQYLTQAQEVT